MKTTKRELAEKYVELKKEFDGKDFKSTIQMHNVEWLIKEFKKEDLEDKVNAVQSAIKMRNKRLGKK